MGLASLQSAISKYYNMRYELRGGVGGKTAIAPENVMMTIGATEALFVSLKALVGPGDEVILFNPGYPWYLNIARVAGATPVLVELRAPSFAPDMEEELEAFAFLAKKYDLFVISDEVYENVTFGGIKHLRIADEEGMFERTVTLGSASKLYSLTGWRVGWALSTPELLNGMSVYHTNMTVCAPAPLQHGLSVAFEAEDGSFEGVPELVEGNALLLGDALREKGFVVEQPQGGHFLVADSTPLGLKGLECAKLMLKHAKVGGVPGIIFYMPDPKDSNGGGENKGVDTDRPLIRFAICKKRETIEEVCRRIRGMVFPPQK
eukprot:jgi/Undpi1/10970/HiC_scaffold_30.g13271.m1